jgi:hypothetical protein
MQQESVRISEEMRIFHKSAKRSNASQIGARIWVRQTTVAELLSTQSACVAFFLLGSHFVQRYTFAVDEEPWRVGRLRGGVLLVILGELVISAIAAKHLF